MLIKSVYTSLKNIDEKLSDFSLKQKRMIKIINHLVDKGKFFDNTIKHQISQIASLTNQIQEQNDFITKILNENQKLKKNLEFYTEIETDSTKLNSVDSLPSSDFETAKLSLSENKNQNIAPPAKIDFFNNNQNIATSFEEKLDEEQEYAFNLLNQTNTNLFITGKAGTGKSYLLRKFAQKTNKKVLLLAPTGIAAININGATLHSTFGYDNLSTLQLEELTRENIKLKREKISLLKAVDCFIIDEISMVRSDIFEKINKILQLIMRNDSVFGGKRFILFGDLYQLPPIAKKNEIKYLKENFGGIFFFSSSAYQLGNFKFIELTINHRQEKDKTFFDILNNIRQDCLTDNDITELNKRFCSDTCDLRRVIRLFSKKDKVDKTNEEELDKILGKEYIYNSVVTYSQNSNRFMTDTSFPISAELKLKVGALVMMVTNDINKRWVNGTLGIVSKLTDDSVIVTIDGIKYDIPQAEFKQQEAVYENGKIEYIPIMTVKQFPIILAYAITIHKSQGMTYQQVACDISDTFAKGQAYVALSRCTTLDGLYLIHKISKTSIFSVDEDVKEFYQKQTHLLKQMN